MAELNLEFVFSTTIIEGEGDDAKETTTWETKTASPELSEMAFAELGITGLIHARDLESLETAKDARLIAGKAWAYANTAKVKATKIAEVEIEIAAIAAEIDALIAAPKPDYAAITEAGGRHAKATDKKQKILDGKTTTTRSSDGDYSNPLPAFETAQAVFRRNNGSRILAIRGDAIPGREDHGLAESWHVFRSNDGFWTYQMAIGAHTSWSALNQCLTTKVLKLPGKSSGTGLLEAIEPINLETIRTTQLTELPIAVPDRFAKDLPTFDKDK